MARCLSPLCAQKADIVEAGCLVRCRPLSAVCRPSHQPPSNKPQHGRPVPQPWRGHLSGHRSILYKLGCVVIEIGETQRILPHPIMQELTSSSSGAFIAATEGSTRPVTVQVTQPGLATVVQYDLRMP
jgi:hypothetical protein